MIRSNMAACALMSVLSSLLAPPLAGADLRVGNVSSYAGNKRWDWTVFITAPADVLDRVRCVEYKLHPTFPEPVQVICDRGYDSSRAFPLTRNGWGEFEIAVTVTFTDRKPQTARHWLSLQAQKSQLCNVLVQRSVTEEDVWSLPDPYRDLHLYVEELHSRKPARIIVFNTKGRIDSRTFDWDDFKKQLRQIKSNQPISLQNYVEVTATAQTLVGVQLSGRPPLQFFVSDAAKGTAHVGVCEAPRGGGP